MTSPYPSATPHVGRFTALVLAFVVLVCVAMIGGTGYLKYQLDRAQAALAAPDSVGGSDQELYDRLRRSLGYGGFLGLAQNYALAHDTAGFAEMKADIKSADEIVAHLPDRTPAEIRHDLTAIVATFDAAFRRLNAPVSEVSEFTIADMAPLYAAIPILDARISAATAGTRADAQGKVQYWSMLLTLVSWCSLIIAAACAAGIYMALRDKHSAPMRALAQSIQNMARGDMRTAIWGVERQDMVGELARAVDIARYHFSHLPDISVLSDQGPVRMRFEGESRSLFEAMMKTISRDSENIREQAASMNATTTQQTQAVANLSTKVESVLQNIARSGSQGEIQIKQAIHDMTASVENLKNVHTHAADQFNRMLPALQERVYGLAEIASITGKQVSQTLQSLNATELGLKTNTEQAGHLLTRLSSTADDLGERMFGAINLLQAGGRIMTEHAQKIGGLAPIDATAKTGAPELVPLPVAATLTEDALQPINHRLDSVAAQLQILAQKISQAPVSDRSHQADQWQREQAAIEGALADINRKIEHLIATAKAEPATLEQITPAPDLLVGMRHLFDQHLNPSLVALNQNIAHLHDATVSQSQGLESVKQDLGEIGRAVVVEVQDKLQTVSDDLRSTLQNQKELDQKTVTALRQHVQASSDGLERKLTTLAQNLPAELRAATDPAFAAVIQKIALSQSGVEQTMAAQHKALLGSITQSEKTTTQMATDYQQAHAAIRHVLLDIADKVTTLSQTLPADMPHVMRDGWHNIAGQIEASREHQDKITTDIASRLGDFEQTVQATLRAAEQAKHLIENPPHKNSDFSAEIQKQLKDQWFQITAQIEASRANLTETVAKHMAKLEKNLTDTASAKNTTRTSAGYGSPQQMEGQTQILTDLVAALGMLDTHVQQIQTNINAKAR